ncbi:unnamed protein product [Arabidopsis thaliana]|uniref:Uncharacterized protein n=1 Tax=Arabidopsis thaliana TaxID=3702 RepID=A0A5S9Y8K0_ARATH|nr:unnamed protein product [Arabidopsis thaliana]
MEKKMKEEEEEPLSPMARAFQEPSIDCGIVIKFGCKTKINPDVIVDSLKLNVFKHPRFCSLLDDDGTKWLRTDVVNVEEHVFVPDIDPKLTEEDVEWFVEDYISSITMIPLDRTKPLWEVHILNGKTSDAEAICVIRCHHALGDGVSILSLILASTRKTSEPEAFSTLPVPKCRESYNHRRGFSFFRLVLVVCSTVRLIWNTLVDSFLCMATIFFLKDTDTPLKGKPGAIKKFSHRIVSLDDIKLIKNAMEMTINDVLLGVTEAALTRYLHQSYDKTNEEAGTSLTPNRQDLLDRIRLRSLIVVNLRPTGSQSIADMMAKGSKCRWGNYISVILFPFTIALQSDPLVYLSNVKSMIDRKKNSLITYIIYTFSEFVIKAFGINVAVAFQRKIMLNTTMCISNLPGPTEEVSFHGHPIAYFAPSIYGLPQALTIHYLSYANKMIISVAVDPMIIDAHKLCDELEESLKNMKLALLKKGLPNHVN